MPRMARVLCGPAIALAVVVLCLASLVGVASAAATTPVSQAPVVEHDGGSNIILRNVYSPDIASALVLRPNDRLIEVRGGVACTEGERFSIYVVVTQASTDAYAVGRTQGFCTGANQIFTLLAVARGPTQFEAGTARAEAFATTYLRGHITDAHTWWRQVALIRGG